MVGRNVTKSDAILKFIIEEKGGRIKLNDIDVSHHTALGHLFVYDDIRYEDEKGKEIVSTERGIDYLEHLKKFYPKAYENLKL